MSPELFTLLLGLAVGLLAGFAIGGVAIARTRREAPDPYREPWQ